MTAIWPYKAIGSLVEAREYLTDVLRAKAGEQRISLRDGPRVTHRLNHLMTDVQLAFAEQIIRGQEDFLVPDWTRVFTADFSAGFGQEIPLPDCYGPDFEQALIWRDWDQYELIDTDPVSSNGSVLTSIAGNWPGARFLPLYPAICIDGISAKRIGKRLNPVDIVFAYTNFPDQPESDYDQYRGLDVLTDCPTLAGGLDRGVAYPREETGGKTGQFFALRDRHLVDFVLSMRWRRFGLCEIQALKSWIDSRRGRAIAFWYPTRGEDLRLAAPIGAAETEMEIEYIELADDTFDIEIVLQSGAIHRRQVVSWVLDSTGVIRLTLSSALGVHVGIDDVRRISFLICARLNNDRVEFNYAPGAGCEVAVQVIECPVPD